MFFKYVIQWLQTYFKSRHYFFHLAFSGNQGWILQNAEMNADTTIYGYGIKVRVYFYWIVKVTRSMQIISINTQNSDRPLKIFVHRWSRIIRQV
jgi:hypothetical protein